MHHLLFTPTSSLTLVYVSLLELVASTLSLQVKRSTQPRPVKQNWYLSPISELGLQQSIYSAYFLAVQGYNIPPMVLNQDNQSTITLISNGKSNSELTRHIQIGYYWVKDLIDRGLITIEYLQWSMPGDHIGTYMSPGIDSSMPAQLNSWWLIFLRSHFKEPCSTRCGRKLLVYPLYELPSNYNL